MVFLVFRSLVVRLFERRETGQDGRILHEKFQRLRIPIVLAYADCSGYFQKIGTLIAWRQRLVAAGKEGSTVWQSTLFLYEHLRTKTEHSSLDGCRTLQCFLNSQGVNGDGVILLCNFRLGYSDEMVARFLVLGGLASGDV